MYETVTGGGATVPRSQSWTNRTSTWRQGVEPNGELEDTPTFTCHLPPLEDLQRLRSTNTIFSSRLRPTVACLRARDVGGGDTTQLAAFFPSMQCNGPLVFCSSVDGLPAMSSDRDTAADIF
ncbi:unnamed protein product [Pleuronectes platessa]|uniref:Uncharacterized protein n=1 Tax=Pleuronectes platessa TaxID=8262 RepID=A0A9N7UNF7_PLEPL|nr:unnamed protein product [Pleuronectes platessa]